MPDVQKTIQSILQAINIPLKGPMPARARCVVCISRDYGTGADEVGHILARRLGTPVYDRDVLDRIAQRLDAEPDTMRAIDASASELRDLWLYSLVTGQNLSADHYKRHLMNVVLSLGRSGGVILGRAAHLILARSGALRVRITGSPEVCAKRVADAEGLTMDAARKRVEQVNHKRAKFVWDNFQERLNDPRTFDLIINTDHILDQAMLADLLVDALRMIGQPVSA